MPPLKTPAASISSRDTGKVTTLHATYSALWDQTVWKYSFINRRNCVFSTRGHFGPFSTDCSYWIRADTVFLRSSPADQQADKGFMTYTDTLYIYGDSCLLDRNKHFHYCIQASDTLFSQD